MVKICEVIEFLNSLAPHNLAESYDNVGVLCDRENDEVNKILLTLDTDFTVAKEAKNVGADLIVSHHPLIFNPIINVNSTNETGKTLRFLIKNDIALYAMHTNFDSVKGGLCDFLAEKIFGKKEMKNLDGESESGIGRIVELDDGITFKSLCDMVKEKLGLKELRVVGQEEKMIKKVAVVGGGGGSMTNDVASLGVDAYISGDFKYQHGRDAYFMDLSLVEITHYDAEIIFCEYLKAILEEKFGDKIEIIVSKENKNVWRTV